MKFRILATTLLTLVSCISFGQKNFSLTSPNGNIRLSLQQKENGVLLYALSCKGKTVIEPSLLGLDLQTPAVNLRSFDVLSVDSSAVNDSWKPVWGEVKEIQNNYRELKVQLKDRSSEGILMNIVFRIFNDGLGFRYVFPSQKNLNHFIVKGELTEFDMTGDHNAWWIPGDFDTNEYPISNTKLSEIDAVKAGRADEISVRVQISKNTVQTPLMMKTADGLYINIHEAALVNYPAMNIQLDPKNFQFSAVLVPDAIGNAAYLQAPFNTPWRTIIVSDKAPDILASKMILNLNEPSAISDVSWIKPMKMVGIWWEMHVGKSTWDYSGTQDGSNVVDLNKPTGRHGATTANAKRYIDFAAKNGIGGVLIEGWNTGWEDWFGKWKENVFDFVTPYPDFDLFYLHKYAASKGVRIIMHHETSGSVTNYERWMDSAYRLMNNLGSPAVKTGYVGKIIPRGEHHDGQWMINHYIRVAQKTASYHIMLDAHEPVRPTGLQRTYPNWLACEAARGNEFNAWSKGNQPEHETILPFTRLMGGPMDYTPGIFKTKMSYYDARKTEQVHTTLVKQLALYVTMYSPLQMAADLLENYEAKPDAFQFIKDVAVDWDDSKYLAAEPGDYVCVARKAKGTNNWFVGAITDENSRNMDINLSFLDAGSKYVATLYRDADDAHWDKNPEAYVIEKFIVDSKTMMKVKLAEGGGCAISIMPATTDDVKAIKKYKAPKK